VNEDLSVNTLVLSALAVLAGYLIGAIPFGYLVTYWVKGIDIRTVGSGNLGATNVGRTLGFRYFVLVFLLDMLKGFLPTLGFPWLLEQLTGSRPSDLPVAVALATILGHTFPVYLKFRGGKGVATSVGAVLALDSFSCGVSVVAFTVLLFLTRYVSLASLGGGLAFVAAHFARESSPLSRDQMVMSLFSVSVLALLVVRHRGNLARIWAGTERKVNFRGRSPESGDQARPDRPESGDQATPSEPQSGDQQGPSGRIIVVVPVVLAVLALLIGGGVRIYQQANEPIEVSAGPWRLSETDRATTGQQRVDRIAFARAGTRLAATCPRYDRVVVFGVEPNGKLTQIREIQLEGRPVALANVGDNFVVLETPTGDQRHVEPGWWETFDPDGNRLGGRHVAGFYPDDLAVTPDGRRLLLLSSGRAEGDPTKPLPALDVVDFQIDAGSSRTVGRITFDAVDDPCRLSLSASGHFAAVLLTKTGQTLAIDLSTPQSPKLIGRTKSTGSDTPYVSYAPDSDWIMMPVASQSEGIAIRAPFIGRQPKGGSELDPIHHVDYLVCTRHRDSVLELFQTTPTQSLGRLPLKGPLNLSRTRPTGLAYARERALLAVATRSGTIHIVKMIPRGGRPTDSGSDPIAVNSQDTPRRR
jgi:acyl-phosphate glycerol 3-phosphate acyltransferase